MKSNPAPFRVGARVQDEYGNLGTVEAVPRSRGGAYHVRMDPTGPIGVRSFANVALLLRSELRGAARRNPVRQGGRSAPLSAEKREAYNRAAERHYAESARHREIAGRHERIGPGRPDPLWSEEAAWRAPAVKAPGRKRNPWISPGDFDAPKVFHPLPGFPGWESWMHPSGHAMIARRDGWTVQTAGNDRWSVTSPTGTTRTVARFATAIKAASGTKRNPAPYDVAAIKRAARAAGHPVYSVKNHATGSLRGLVSVYFDEPLPGPEAMSRVSEWLRARYPDVPFSGLKPQQFCDYWLRYSAAERKAKDARPTWGVRSNPGTRDAAWLRWFATLDAEGAIEALDPYHNRDPEDVLREARRILASAPKRNPASSFTRTAAWKTATSAGQGVRVEKPTARTTILHGNGGKAVRVVRDASDGYYCQLAQNARADGTGDVIRTYTGDTLKAATAWAKKHLSR